MPWAWPKVMTSAFLPPRSPSQRCPATRCTPMP
jgi:hypothetical protein